MRTMLAAAAVLSVFSTAALADQSFDAPGEAICMSARPHESKLIIAECTKFIASKKLGSLYVRIRAHSIRGEEYRKLGDTERELADWNYVIENAESKLNDDPSMTLGDKDDALMRRAEIYEKRGLTQKAADDRAEAEIVRNKDKEQRRIDKANGWPS